MNEAQRRGYKKVRITKHVGGWPVGSIVWHDGNGNAWNDDCSKHYSHSVGNNCEYVEDEKMKIEAGKYYKTRDGQVVGPMMKTPDNDMFDSCYVWTYDSSGVNTSPENLFCRDGKYWGHGSESDFDLIAPAYPEQGTLKEIGAKPGDVVEFIIHPRGYQMHEVGMRHYIAEDGKAWDRETYDGQYWDADSDAVFLIISRASGKPTSPVRTVTTTRKEIVPGVYGRISIHKNAHDDGRVLVRLADSAGEVNLENCGHYMTSDELTAAIATITQIRDALT